MAKKTRTHGCRLTSEQESKVRELYPNLGPTALAKLMSISRNTLIAAARRLGVSFRPQKSVAVVRVKNESTRDYLTRKLLANIIKKDSGCWEWTGGHLTSGYGSMAVGGKQRTTHRIAWILFKGPLPKKAHVCHRCDNPPCCNPDHLFLGDIVTNTTDRHQKERDACGFDNGNAQLTDEQVHEIRKSHTGAFGEVHTLAKKYGVSTDQIRNILVGRQRMKGIEKIWWVPYRATKISDDNVRAMRSVWDATPQSSRKGLMAKLMRKHGVSIDQVRNIVLRKQRKDVV